MAEANVSELIRADYAVAAQYLSGNFEKFVKVKLLSAKLKHRDYLQALVHGEFMNAD